MPLIKLNPDVSPQGYYDENHEQLGIVPDGTGLQILFKVQDDYYIIAGPRTNQILSVNGGKIEKKDAPFAVQLAEELEEETFGMMKMVRTEDGYQLVLKNGSTHPLSIQDDKTFLAHKKGAYAYVTFTAICDSLSLAELKEIAATLTPTASIWNKIGNYLFPHSKNAPKDEAFAAYWQTHFEERKTFIAALTEEYKQLISSGTQLLIDPVTAFQKNTIEEALNTLHEINDYKALNAMSRANVGRYSERSQYAVFTAAELLRAAPWECTEKNVTDVDGKIVATDGIYNGNREAVTRVLSSLITPKKEVTPHVKLSMFPQAEEPTTTQPGLTMGFQGK